jgi:UDP-N-acetylmuramate dehydrogenase
LAISIASNYSLESCNSFGFPARAEHFVSVTSEQDLCAALDAAKSNNWPVTLIGGGSNLVLTKDVSGLVIQIALLGREQLGCDVILGAGENWHDVVRWTVKELHLQGLESLALIPGTVGAAPVQNIGAYGVELNRLNPRVRAFDRQTDSFVEFDTQQSAYAYRDSVFKRERDRYVITQVRLSLQSQDTAPVRYQDLAETLGVQLNEAVAIESLFEGVVRVRQRKLPNPDDLGNAGSFFKNPVVGVDQAGKLKAVHPNMPVYPAGDDAKLSAGWLIEQAGWKGHRHNGVGVSEKHALVLVHYGNENGQTLMRLAAQIQQSVEAEFGVRLEPEPRIL